MSTVYACAYNSEAVADTLATYYGQDAVYQRMADYLVGAASQFDLQSVMALAIGRLEGGGPGNNWLQLGDFAATGFIENYWSRYNRTGLPAPTVAQVQRVDQVNAAAGIYWYVQGPDCGQTGWQALLSRSSAYNGVCTCTCPYSTAYGWSSLFFAFGREYSQIHSDAYFGTHYVTAPTGTQTAYLNQSCGPGRDITVPPFATTRTLRDNPWGRNGQGRAIVLLAKTPGDFVSALQVDINQYNHGYMAPVVTADAEFAVRSTLDLGVCVIAVGNQAVIEMELRAQELKIGVHAHANVASWRYNHNRGDYVTADGRTGFESYSLANMAATQAHWDGW